MSDPIAVNPKKKRGCFFYGGIIAAVLLAITLFAGIFMYRFVMRRFNGFIAQYTEDRPRAIAETEMPPAELQQLNQRLDAYLATLNAHSNAMPLILSASEINALIANAPQMSLFKNNLHVSLESNLFKCDLSLPLEHFVRAPLLHVKGRYLNGDGVFNASISQSTLQVSMLSFEVRGEPVPQVFITQMQNKNMADGFVEGTNAAFFKHFQSLDVKGDEVILTPKPVN